MLSVQFGRPLPTIQLALQTFESYGMIEVVDDILKISNWEKYQNIEGMEKIREQNRIRQKNWYDRQKALPNATPNVSITESNATDIDKNKNKKEKKSYITFGEYQNVKLTQEEFDRLGEKYGKDIRDMAIDFFDKYLVEKPDYKTKSHNMTIQRWVIDAVKEKKAKQKPGFSKMENTNKYDFSELEKQIRSN